jgi:methenyltetrahydromethanopterin cyclohydrolase
MSGALDALLSVELRQLGGAVGRPTPGQGAVGHFDAAYAMYAVGIAPVPPAKQAVLAAIGTVTAALEQHRSATSYINFHERPTDPADVYPSTVHRRLAELKRWYDPTDVIRSNHPIAPAA